jgi:hypothetical protein
MVDPVPKTITGKYSILLAKGITSKYDIKSLLPLEERVQVDFTNGSVAYTVGETITGSVSGTTGTVYAINVTSGSWAGGDAAGTVILTDITRG